MQDVITREILVKANKEAVYSAITDPAKIVMWFPETIEGGTLEPGQRPTFVFSGGKHKAKTYIEKAVPFSYFSYRWVPRAEGPIDDILTVPNTLVEFFIDEEMGGTKVTVKESGFSALPIEVAKQAFEQNSGGWEIMMNRLEKVLNHA
jgi:uncharacterized protein YndB with AHSA1/START domain